MIKFDLASLNEVKKSLEQAGEALVKFKIQGNHLSKYTTVPSLSGAFLQHGSFWSGQSGSAKNVVDILTSNVNWLLEVFSEEKRRILSPGSFG